MSNLSDVIGGANMSGSLNNVSFVTDRFCNANSAMFFNNASGLKIPSGVYLSGDFTITAWINLKANQSSYMRLIDLGNGSYVDNTRIFINSMRIYYVSSMNSTISRAISTNSFLKLNTWYHVSVTLNSNTGNIYVNGSLAATGTAYAPRNILRYNNMIGNVYPIAIYDDLKIYQGAMSQEQVLNDYIASSNNGILSYFKI